MAHTQCVTGEGQIWMPLTLKAIFAQKTADVAHSRPISLGTSDEDVASPTRLTSKGGSDVLVACQKTIGRESATSFDYR